MSSREATTAVRRFGLGAKPGELARIGRDPRGYLLAALERKDAALLADASLEPSEAIIVKTQQATVEVRISKAFREDGGALLKANKAAGETKPDSMAGAGDPGNAAMQGEAAMKAEAGKPAVIVDKPQQIRREVFQREMAARMAHARTTDAAFVERLVMFWSNHFAVNANKAGVLGIAGAFEREAIRPHVLGRFAEMLQAVEQHPAMLIYLDNQASTGPNSQVGRNRNRGLNENLAREILELHTLGVDGGYSQADVTSLARVITGWTVGQLSQPNVEPGRFHFAANRHEPGLHKVVGKTYGNAGAEAGRQCLADLAVHPSTARHIARKLAAHFIVDPPPPAAVSRIETAFRDSDGDLAQVARALVTSQEAWSAPPRKVLPPYDFIIALERGLGITELAPPERQRLMLLLGQPLWRPPSPKGWPDADETWAGPSALRERLRIAERLSVWLAQHGQDPRAQAEALFGDALSEHTRQAVARAEAREQAFALLIMSPEFQRR